MSLLGTSPLVLATGSVSLPGKRSPLLLRTHPVGGTLRWTLTKAGYPPLTLKRFSVLRVATDLRNCQ